MDSQSSAQAIPPLVVAGMHRSGTSLAASILAGAGVSMGDELVPATASNPKGHFEDVAFFRLQQRMLVANGLSQEGYACPDRIPVPGALRCEAEALVASRRAAARPWGWKDPRTTLFLDLWDELLPDARYLFIFRSPGEVVDSLFRRGDAPFQDNPRLALDLWLAYNRRIRDFARGRPERCLLVETASVAADAEGLVARVGRSLGVPLAVPTPRYEAGMLVARDAATHAVLVHCLRPEALELLDELRQLAGATGADRGTDPAAAERLAAATLAEWARTGVAIGERARREGELAERVRTLEAAAAERDRLAAANATLAGELRAEREARLAIEAQARASAEELRLLTTTLAAERARHSAAARAHADELTLLAERHAADLLERTRVAEEQGRTIGQRSAALEREIEKERSRRVTMEADAARRIEAANAENDRLAVQLQSERETFETLRYDLVARLETAVRPVSKPRRTLGERLAAEGRRFANRFGRRRRSAA